METVFVGPDRTVPGRAGPGLAMPRAETGRALNSIRARGPGREVYGPGRADKIRPVQISDRLITDTKLFKKKLNTFFV